MGILYRLIDFTVHGDVRGKLVAIEQFSAIPFEIKRVYYLFNTECDAIRGMHAHRNLKQVLIAIKGQCKIKLDDGENQEIVVLDSPTKGLLIDSYIWRELYDFSPDCVVLTLASELYDPSDYIFLIEDFKKEVKKNQKQLSYDIAEQEAGVVQKQTVYYIHENAIVETKDIGSDTRIWAFTHILRGAKIGANCNINDHTFIENDVIIGDHVTVKSGVYIWDGLRVGNNVFIGPNVTFTNDLTPRSKRYPAEFLKTYIDNYASIGANSTIIAGVKIGRYAMIGAGSIVTKDIPPYTLWYGNPAVFHGFVCECGTKLVDYYCSSCQRDRKEIIKRP